MGSKKILEHINQADVTLKIGNEIIMVEVKKPKEGYSVDKLISELKKASKENLLTPDEYARTQKNG